jgi:magnesium-transporting ATPase (P-type)
VQVTGFAYGVTIPTACYLLVDVVAVLLLTFAMTCARPREDLAPRRPTASLFSAYTQASVIGSLFFGVATFVVLQVFMNIDPADLKWPAYLSSTETFWLNGEITKLHRRY